VSSSSTKTAVEQESDCGSVSDQGHRKGEFSCAYQQDFLEHFWQAGKSLRPKKEPKPGHQCDAPILLVLSALAKIVPTVQQDAAEGYARA